MISKDISGKDVVVLGAARSGLAAAKLMQSQGASVFVSDRAPVKKMKHAQAFLEGLGVPYEFGLHSEKVWQGDLVVLSPGIPPSSEIVKEIRSHHIPVYSELEVASWYCSANIIAITGSNGKTTTTTLLGEMLKLKHPQSIIAGNIGSPLSSYVMEENPAPWAAVEVSSFQLETIDSFHPKIVILLNLSPNHLDWYNSYEDYIIAKMRILKNLDESDFLIHNGEDQELTKRVSGCAAQMLTFALSDQQARGYVKDQQLILNGTQIIDTTQIVIRGRHNYANALAAGLAAQIAGIMNTQIAQALKEFRGVPHRLEPVTTINGINLINDSKATTIESLAAALRSFDQKIILIAGGKDKGADFTTIRDLVARSVRYVVLIGKASNKIYSSWHDLVAIDRADDLEQAIGSALAQAKSGEYIVFSPACASFDMFSDYEDRGNTFKKLVMRLKDQYETE